MKYLPIVLTAAALAASPFATHAGDAAAGKAKTAVCMGCHGPDGNSTNPIWPKLAGQHAAYLVKTLKDFKSGARKDPSMNAMVAPLTDEDIENIAAYYASQKQR
ncbi:MAG: c-type cytochrome [Gammaproteobacteria bacterium]